MAKSDDRFSDNVLDERTVDETTEDTRPASPPAAESEAAEPGPLGDPAELRRIFAGGSRDERCAALARVLSFAPWDDIWEWVDRDEARDLFPDVELPAGLRGAWARYLGVTVDASADGDA